MSVMRGCGRPSITVWSNVLSCVIVGYPLAFSLTFAANGKLVGLWGAMSSAWLVATCVYAIVIFRMNWSREAEIAQQRSQVTAPRVQETAM
jgi:MATE family multidrug resistance protein